jgi:ribonuclease P protein component
MLGRLVLKADFERLLATRSRSRSAHFALHHVPSGVIAASNPANAPDSADLSTAPAPTCPQPVDDSNSGLWIGCVVPKRHAKRSVTRSLLKRQIRGAFARHAPSLSGGHWLVRLREGFPKARFVSAASPALAQAAREELDQLLARVASPAPAVPAVPTAAAAAASL